MVGMLRLRRHRSLLLFAIFLIAVLYHFPSLKDNHNSWSVDQLKYHTKPITHDAQVPASPHDERPQAPLPEVKEPPKAPLPAPPIPPAEKPSPKPFPPSQEHPPAPSIPQSPSTDNVPSRPAERPGGPPVWKPEDEASEPSGTPGRWEPAPEHYPLDPAVISPIPTAYKTVPQIQASFGKETPENKEIRLQRREAVRSAFKHAWAGYKKYAWGHDEVRPVSNTFRDPFGGWGATLVDSLDTLYIMGLEHEFIEAVNAVVQIDFTTTPMDTIPVFETVIRYLGGLIAAYDISGQKHKVLLQKAIELGDIIFGVFDTPNRMPILQYGWRPEQLAKKRHAGAGVVLAELGSLTVEYTRLAQITGNSSYYDAVQRITDALEEYQFNTGLPGLWPIHIDASGCKLIKEKPSSVAIASPTPSTPTDIFADDPGSTGNGDLLGGLGSFKKRSGSDYPTPNTINGSAYNQVGTLPDEEETLYTGRSSNIGKEMADTTSEVTSRDSLKPSCLPQGLAKPHSLVEEKYTLGGMADSTFEYLVKEYLLLGGALKQYRNMYEAAFKVSKKNLFYRPFTAGDPDILLSGNIYVKGETTTRMRFDTETSHLTCFVGGMIALGAKAFDREADLAIASKLTDGCVWAYNVTATGIMPENFRVAKCDDPNDCHYTEEKWLSQIMELRLAPSHKAKEEPHRNAKRQDHSALAPVGKVGKIEGWGEAGDAEIPVNLPVLDESMPMRGKIAGWGETIISEVSATKTSSMPSATTISDEESARNLVKKERLPSGFTYVTDSKYILRPEAIESVFVMYRVTADTTWQDKGWIMFERVMAATRTEIAHSAINDVTLPLTHERFIQKDEMESFWLAETLKYYYLLFSEPDLVSLDDYILNTEAHPLQRPKNRKT
ncbi:hypothetical protein RUND412_000531 [Rhizina undulata]